MSERKASSDPRSIQPEGNGRLNRKSRKPAELVEGQQMSGTDFKRFFLHCIVLRDRKRPQRTLKTAQGKRKPETNQAERCGRKVDK